jgi:hypothetical protein
MKKMLFIFSFLAVTAFGQYRDTGFPTSTVKDGIINNSGFSLFGLNSNNFNMNHSYSLSYSSFGSNGLALGVYTNSMVYQFNKDLNVQADVSVVHSPYSSFGQEFQNSLTGIYLSRAAINYRPWENFQINVQYRSLPNYYYPGSYGGYDNRFFRSYDYDPFWGF